MVGQKKKRDGESVASKSKKRRIDEGRVYVIATLNNTLITITDRKGNRLVQSSSGGSGFRGSRKRTPYAAQIASEKAGSEVQSKYGMKKIMVVVKGPGPGRESAIRALISLGFEITEIEDGTTIPHNGCRPKKERRV
jgi:small subunit ribosomal protein S11